MTVSTVVANTVVQPSEDAHEINATYRKITWRLIPFFALLWMLTWIDRVNVGYVKLIGTSSAFPVFWQMPNQLLSGSAAAVGVALIISFGNLARFGSPYMLSAVKASTGGLAPGLLAIVAIQLLAAALTLFFVPKNRTNRRNPLTNTARKS